MSHIQSNISVRIKIIKTEQVLSVPKYASLNECSGIILRAYRKAIKATQREIADHLNISYQSMSLFECGNRAVTLRHIHAFANYANINPSNITTSIYELYDCLRN